MRDAATNPCGEQPLPPNGDCDLGHVNLANMVLNPFTPQAAVDWDRLNAAVGIGVHFLDNVLDTSPFPTEEQRAEALAKRRIGPGYTGLGNLLQQMRVRYGRGAVALVEQIGEGMLSPPIALQSTLPASAARSRPRYRGVRPRAVPAEAAGRPRRGHRHAWHPQRRAANAGADRHHLDLLRQCQPGRGTHLQLAYDRNVVIEQNLTEQKLESFEVQDYGWYLYSRMPGFDAAAALPDYMITALELSVDDHIAVAAAAQAWVDAAISKTINCPADMPYEAFREVYLTAYREGMKGCTTYRPSGMRGSVLSVKAEMPAVAVDAAPALPVSDVLKRPQTLSGKTVNIKWPIDGENYYLTINDYVYPDGKRMPFRNLHLDQFGREFRDDGGADPHAVCRVPPRRRHLPVRRTRTRPLAQGGALVRLDDEVKGT